MKFSSLLYAFLFVAVCNVSWASNSTRVVYIHINSNNVIESVDTFPNWFNLDQSQDNVMGVSTEQTYKTLLKGKKGETVIVAVIDSGVDIEHEDLKDVIWRNPGEKPGNGIDDDGNGYIDDVYGWNFIGGKDGSHVNDETLELTRVYKKLHAKYKDSKKEDLSKKEKKEFDYYQGVKETYEKKSGEAKQNYTVYKGIYDGYLENLEVLKKVVGKDEVTEDDLKDAAESKSDEAKAVVEFFDTWAKRGVTFDGFAGLKGAVDYYEGGVKYFYNLEFDSRKIVGDNYADGYESDYGNNSVIGPDATHGTHVAGIIAAARNNNIGMDGVADNVQIMVLRTVPNGDERDKDVANSIRYAVDNGATVINMSFGKAYSWDKKIVDDAVKYAAKHDVLLVHAAGNDSKNTDVEGNFPKDAYDKSGWFSPKSSPTWIEVGALSWKKDEVAVFSNYAKENVDLFAPGVDLNSTVPGSEYKALSGTSMASPVVAGVAAVLRSYYPELSAKQIKEVLMASTIKTGVEYNKPGSKDEKMKMSEMCVTGGIVNLYEAAKMAETMKGKRKSKHRKASQAKVNRTVRP